MRPIRMLVATAAASTLALGLTAGTTAYADRQPDRQQDGKHDTGRTGSTAWTGFSLCTKPALTAYRCGTLTVPLERSSRHREGRTLDLSVLEGGNPNASRTMLFLTGGPGQPGPDLAPRILQALSGVTDQYRVIFLDQRGTGDRPLVCPELQAQRGFSDLRVPTRQAIRDCAELLGPDRAHYSTTDSVADFEALRRALGVQRWAVNGVSYGTYTGQRYAAVHPDRVSHLVLDSVVPIAGFNGTLVSSYPDYTRVLRDVCADPARACPGDMANDLRTILRREPARGPMMFDFVTTVAYADAETFLDLPQWLHDGAAGNMAPIDQTYAEWHEAFAATPSQYSQGIQASTFCADSDFPWGGADSWEQTRDWKADRAVSRYSSRELFPFNAEAARGNGLMTLCEHWPRVRDEEVPDDELSLAGVNALIINGERDLGTPLHWAKAAHRAMPGSELIVVPNAGHSIQIGRHYPEVNQAVADFLLDR
ncbi:alpha/beta hydrolase [Nocardioides speluncae]|uniref:alpha/beta hydrolase n=1 Tax=Nocardioides speluncae TaxID=2670337 RepID=UPI000D695740|nr:alpha/beta hydrolase [Nocardioides speluncae]